MRRPHSGHPCLDTGALGCPFGMGCGFSTQHRGQFRSGCCYHRLLCCVSSLLTSNNPLSGGCRDIRPFHPSIHCQGSSLSRHFCPIYPTGIRGSHSDGTTRSVVTHLVAGWPSRIVRPFGPPVDALFRPVRSIGGRHPSDQHFIHAETTTCISRCRASPQARSVTSRSLVTPQSGNVYSRSRVRPAASLLCSSPSH